MALRGFSCPNCHTWFEGEGNHPKCPLCERRASPRDLLDAREQQQPGSEQRTTYWEFEAPPSASPGDYDLPTPDAPDYEVSPEQAPNDEAPRETARPQGQGQGGGYDEVRHYDAASGQDTSWEGETTREYESPAGVPENRPEEKEGSNWSERIGPAIGVLIFIAVILSNVCDALSSSD